MTVVSEFCTSHRIEWHFIPERTPHFGGLWEAAVRSTKGHLRRIVGDVRLTFEELTTVLAQIEACLNSLPMVPFDLPDDDGVEVLTPGHFLIGHPICALPDPPFIPSPCCIVGIFVRTSCITSGRGGHRNIDLSEQVHEVALSYQESTRWGSCRAPGRRHGTYQEVHYGKDGMVRVATVKTTKGSYKRPVNKLALLLASD